MMRLLVDVNALQSSLTCCASVARWIVRQSESQCENVFYRLNIKIRMWIRFPFLHSLFSALSLLLPQAFLSGKLSTIFVRMMEIQKYM